MNQETIFKCRMAQAVRHPWPKIRVPFPKRPEIREDCQYVPRPCPWITCRHNLFCDVIRGKIEQNAPTPWDMPAHRSCVLDIVELEGKLNLKEIGREIYGFTRERARQIALVGLRKFRTTS